MSIYKKISPTTAIIIAMVLGAVCGLVVGEPMGKIQFLGDMFFRLILMGIIPFVMGQIIEAVGSLTKKELSTTGVKTIVLFLVSSAACAAIGVASGVIFDFKLDVSLAELTSETVDPSFVAPTVQEMITNFIPKNIVDSMAKGSMVQVIVFSALLGVAISFWRSSHDGKSLVYDFIVELNELLLHIIRIVMYIAPIGVFAYVSGALGMLGWKILIPLGKYILVLALATLVATIIWFIVISITCRMSLPLLIKKMMPMNVMAAATISSAVTLPLEMNDAKNKLGLNKDIANLVLPLGMPLNSNGSALHMALTAMVISQMYGVTFDLPGLISVGVISLLLSLANAVAPGATLISLTMLVPQLGLPTASIAIFGGLEYIVAAIRTTLNVSSDVFCALLVAKDVPDGIDYDIFYDRKVVVVEDED